VIKTLKNIEIIIQLETNGFEIYFNFYLDKTDKIVYQKLYDYSTWVQMETNIVKTNDNDYISKTFPIGISNDSRFIISGNYQTKDPDLDIKDSWTHLRTIWRISYSIIIKN
jgi:hypothetical protein